MENSASFVKIVPKEKKQVTKLYRYKIIIPQSTSTPQIKTGTMREIDEEVAYIQKCYPATTAWAEIIGEAERGKVLKNKKNF